MIYQLIDYPAIKQNGPFGIHTVCNQDSHETLTNDNNKHWSATWLKYLDLDIN